VKKETRICECSEFFSSPSAVSRYKWTLFVSCRIIFERDKSLDNEKQPVRKPDLLVNTNQRIYTNGFVSSTLLVIKCLSTRLGRTGRCRYYIEALRTIHCNDWRFCHYVNESLLTCSAQKIYIYVLSPPSMQCRG
jgi:hypothetical protein